MSSKPSTTRDTSAKAGALQPLAIVGIGAMFPKASELTRYWFNLREGVDAITDIPATHWSASDYFDADPGAPDRTYAKRGGFLSPVKFDPLKFGISPNNLEATDTAQLLGMLVAQHALQDAGYLNPDATTAKPFDRDRVSVVLGVTSTLELVVPLGARLSHPLWKRALDEAGVDEETARDVMQRISDGYVPWQENSFPGLLGNVVAGRIANRLDLGGTNCVIDAACASSLGALHLAAMELYAGRADMIVTGGVDTFNDIFMYMCFSKTPALSPTGDSRPFASNCDGTILGEGLGLLAIKRLDDAQRDGDRVYAVIKGVGSASDGKSSGIYAPRAEGQIKALNNAYAQANVTPDTIELVEAHGTGTKVGDATEAKSLTHVYSAAGAAAKLDTWCALGSVKSQIGHTKASAGVAGLIKASLALYQKVLPPTIKVDRPLDVLAKDSPFYVNTNKRPWLPTTKHPRRAAVSAFGFGGSNFHCVLEEAQSNKPAIDWEGAPQIFAFSGSTPSQLSEALDKFPDELSPHALRKRAAESRAQFQIDDVYRLVIISEEDGPAIGELLAAARATLEKRQSTHRNIYFAHGAPAGKLAMLFPGQGSQYPNMLRDLACQFPQMLDSVAAGNVAFGTDQPGKRLSDFVYPFPAFDDATRKAHEEALRATNVAQPALGAVSLGALALLRDLGVTADAAIGHSFGELCALHAAGCFDEAQLHTLACTRGSLMAQQGNSDGNSERDAGSMLAISSSADNVQKLIDENKLDIIVANINSPRQVVVSGATKAIEKTHELCTQKKLSATRLRVAAAFHSALVSQAREPFAKALTPVKWHKPALPVHANATAQPYPADSTAAKELLASQLVSPVRFVEQVKALHDAGVRTFIEVGPGSVLTRLVGDILADAPHKAVALDSSKGKRSGTLDLAHLLAQLAALGHSANLSRWQADSAIAPLQVEETSLTRFTVELSGANYVKPRTPRPRRERSATATTPVPATSHATPPATPTPMTATPTSVSPLTTVSVMNQNTSPATSPATPAPTDQTALGQAMQMTQHHLAALQQVQQQTAQLHQQFLENQQAAQRSFQMLIVQQQQLMQSVLGQPASQVDLSSLIPPPPAAQAAPSALAEPTPPAPVAQQAAPAPVELAPQPAEPAADNHTQDVLFEVVSEKTGYPVEMLELPMALDSDLGIDSIKRVEIFSALQEKLPDAPPVKPEDLGTLQTLADVVKFITPANAPAPAPAAAQASAAPTPQAPPQGGQGSAIQDVLFEVVSEKTGYPVEMLELPMALDSDLGIDSIKRVEIFSALQEKLPDAPPVKPEDLGTLQTLADVVAFLTPKSPDPDTGSDGPGGGSSNGASKAREPAHANGERAAPGAPAIERSVIASAQLSQDERPAWALSASAPILITNDGSELAPALAEQLQSMRLSAELIQLDELDAAALPAQLSGIVILTPARGANQQFLQQALMLSRRAAALLTAQAKTGAAAFMTVSRVDGSFGFTGSAHDALSGALAGLAKTASHEWTNVACKAIDLAPKWKEARAIAAAIADELVLRGPVEVGLSPRGRTMLELLPAPLSGMGTHVPLAKGDVVAISGGARGVTAEIAVALAEQYQATLVLLGRTQQPHDEPDWLRDLTDEPAIKQALMKHLAPENRNPRTIGQRYNAIIANREVERTLARIRKAGGRGIYQQLNVRDADAVKKTMQQIRSEVGPIRGLIHGAGVLADKLIQDKTAQQFDDVFGTKVGGAQNLLSATANDKLQLLVLFASTTARFGRRGQVDYAMANEALNKLARQQAMARPQCKVVSANWGPWDGGMVTPALRKVFANEGVGVIDLRAGAQYLMQEISQPIADGPVEVVVLGQADQPASSAAQDTDAKADAGPMDVAFERTISIDTAPILCAHVLNNRATLPAALMLEWLTTAALHANPGLHLVGADDLRVLKGLMLEGDQPRTVQVCVTQPRATGDGYAVSAQLRSVDGRRMLPHASATVLLSDAPIKTTAAPLTIEHADKTLDHDRIYQDLLFHGEPLQMLSSARNVSAQAMEADIAAGAAPGTWLKQPLRSSWTTAPLAIDGLMQMILLTRFMHDGNGSLPSHVARYRQFTDALATQPVRALVKVERHADHQTIATAQLCDSSGRVLAQLEGALCVADPMLSRTFRRNELPQTNVLR